MTKSITDAFVIAFEKTVCYLIPIFIFLHLSIALNAQGTCALTCNNGLQISLAGPDQNCEALITPELMMQNANACPGAKTVTITDASGSTLPQIMLGEDLITVVNDIYIGQTLNVVVKHNLTGNSCWGSIIIEDKLAPVISDCEIQNVYCFQNPAPVTEGGAIEVPTAIDCSSVDASYTDTFVDGGCDDNYSAHITRSWIFTDAQGNTSTCEQEIIIDRVSSTVYTPSCPAQVSLECNASNQPNTAPSATGYPYIDIDGNLLTTDDLFILDNNEIGYCELGISHSDEIIPTCGSGYKILRTWNVYDWCLPTSPGLNPWTCIQVIKVQDFTPPVVQTPATYSVSTSSNECTAVVNIPAATVSDLCSNVSVTTTTPLGILSTNGGLVAYPGLPIGDNTITYVATDECGNITTESFIITVEDNTAPVAICDQNTTVSLQADGMATIYAQTFDDGSFDNCGVDKVEVRRMTSDCGLQTPFAPTVQFTCCDIENGPITVALRVTDIHGNFNICMVQVEVQDKLDPVILCPPNKLLNCDEDYTDLSLTGEATAIDNCAIESITSNDQINLSACNEGTITRRWIATDIYGNSTTCIQLITLQNDDVFTRDQIQFPDDYETSMCGAELLPSNLPAPFNYPVINEGACDQVAVTYEDTYLPVTPPACFKILRKWIVVDWCQYEVNGNNSYGYWEHNQLIKVNNTEAPVFSSSCADINVCSYEDNCGPTHVTLTIDATDDCTHASDLIYEYTILADLNNDGIKETTIGPLSGNDASGEYPLGTHTIMWNVEDGCGNTRHCEYNFTIEDCKKPTPYCINGLAVELMPNSGEVTIWASDFDAGSYDNCGIDEMRIATLSGGPGQTTPPVGTTDYLTFDCLQLGTNTVDFWVKDTNGNWDYCTSYIIVQDNGNACGTSATISGSIENMDGEEIEEVTVDIEGVSGIPVITGADGSFAFPSLPIGTDYTVTPQKTINPINGISTYDVLLMTKHILGLRPLDSPYKIIAADINNSGSITGLDIVQLRKLILYIDEDFTNNTSWRFVDKNFDFPNPQNPFATPFPEVSSIADLSIDESLGFYGIKIGDMNDSAIPNSLLGNTRSVIGETTIHADDIDMKSGETYEVKFTAKEFETIVACQYTLAFDQNAVEFIDFNAGVFDENNFGFSLISDGFITTSWDNAEDQKINAETSLYSLTFRAKKDISLNKVLNINSRYTAAEAYNTDADVLDVRLTFGKENEPLITKPSMTLFQNQPNPFKEQTTIAFELADTQEATLSIFDVSGKIIKQVKNTFSQGYNEVLIKRGEINAVGMLYYQLETANETITKKMIVID